MSGPIMRARADRPYPEDPGLPIGRPCSTVRRSSGREFIAWINFWIAGRPVGVRRWPPRPMRAQQDFTAHQPHRPCHRGRSTSRRSATTIGGRTSSAATCARRRRAGRGHLRPRRRAMLLGYPRHLRRQRQPTICARIICARRPRSSSPTRRRRASRDTGGPRRHRPGGALGWVGVRAAGRVKIPVRGTRRPQPRCSRLTASGVRAVLRRVSAPSRSWRSSVSDSG